MKVVFITISQALLIRNILRSGTLDLLKKSGHKIVIFILCKEIPKYIAEEFADDNVILISVQERDFKMGKIHRKFVTFTHFILYNKTTKRYFRYSRHYINKSRVMIWYYLASLRIISSLTFLRPLVRWLEEKVFIDKNLKIEKFFEQYQPDLVFSTSITAKMDNVFLKIGKERGVKTISMTKSWDNATKMYFRFVPDYFLVQNEIMKERLSVLQDFPLDKIYVVGFPQFDWYKQPGIIRSREEHCKRMGLDPKLPLLFFGSQGVWFDQDHKVAEKIYQWIKNDELIKPCQLLIRPHFTNVKTTPLLKFKDKPQVVYDDTYHVSDLFPDNWDPTTSEIVDFTNTIFHSDVIIIILSTIALDAACSDKPVVNALFGSIYQGKKDVTFLMQSTDHYQWVLDTQGTSIAENADELKEAINQYLVDPQFKSAERQVLRDELCYKVDGQSSRRIVEVINDVLIK